MKSLFQFIIESNQNVEAISPEYSIKFDTQVDKEYGDVRGLKLTVHHYAELLKKGKVVDWIYSEDSDKKTFDKKILSWRKKYSKPLNESHSRDINFDLMAGEKLIIPDITEDDLVNAEGGSSFMDDRSWIVVNGTEYTKIKKDGWQGSSPIANVLTGVINSKELFKRMAKSSRDPEGWTGVIYK